MSRGTGQGSPVGRIDYCCLTSRGRAGRLAAYGVCLAAVVAGEQRVPPEAPRRADPGRRDEASACLGELEEMEQVAFDGDEPVRRGKALQRRVLGEDACARDGRAVDERYRDP